MEIIIGIIAGMGTGLGISGGTILILLLNVILGYNQHISQAINLICFIPAALVSIVFNFRKKNIHIKDCYIIVFFGIIGALIGSIISKNMNVHYLKKAFGYFLLLVSMYEIFDLYNFIKKNKNPK